MDNSAELQMPRLTPDHVGSVVSVIVFSSIVLKTEHIVALFDGQSRLVLKAAGKHLRNTQQEYGTNAPLCLPRELDLR
jgi:hypothetical protein